MARNAKPRSRGRSNKRSVSKKELTNEKVDTEMVDTKSTESKTDLPSSSNDPTWYSRDPRLTIDSSNIPFSTPFGAKLELLRTDGMAFPGQQWTLNANARNNCLPGICSLKLKTSVGSNLGPSSPLNIAANALYSHVRYVNNGRKNYDPVDLMLYTLFFGDLYSYLIWCMRLYQYAFMYSQRNWYIGKAMIEANGVDAEDLKLNLANFRYMINVMIRKIASYAVPEDIYYFRRRAFLFANYYLENQYGNLRDQLYQFVPDGFYMFDYDTEGAGKLTYKRMDFSNKWKLQDFDYYFQTLMQNVTGDEDFGLMSGDIVRAYGDHILKLGDLAEEGGLMPVYDPYVLSQFKNAVVCNGLRRDDVNPATFQIGDKTYKFGDLMQSNDGLFVSLEQVDWSNSKGLSAVMASNQLLSVENPDPNVGDVVEATRLHVHYYIATSTIGYVIGGGTEIVVDVLLSYQPDAIAYDGLVYYNGFRRDSDESGMIDYENVYLMMFKYAPIDYAIAYAGTSSPASIVHIDVMSNVENTTVVMAQQLARINEAAMLSLFFVPGVAKLI